MFFGWVNHIGSAVYPELATPHLAQHKVKFYPLPRQPPSHVHVPPDPKRGLRDDFYLQNSHRFKSTLERDQNGQHFRVDVSSSPTDRGTGHQAASFIRDRQTRMQGTVPPPPPLCSRANKKAVVLESM